MKKLFLILFFCFISIFVYSSSIKFLWWNVHNFFDTVDNPDKDDTVLTINDYNKKMNLIGEKINEFNADFVGLCEVENLTILKQLANKTGYQYFYLIEGNDPRGINVCILSKYQVNYITHKNQKTPYKGNKNYKFSRDCTESIIEIDGKELYILLTHLKSKLNDENGKSEIKQIAQVNGILDIISNIYTKSKEEPFLLLMGDLNSNRYSQQLNNLEKSNLKIINYLYKENNVYTMVYKGKKQDIDYVIFNENLFSSSKIKSFKSINSKEMKKISDHFPIFFEIELK